MKIFISGGSGFIGQNLSKKLVSEGHSVTVLSRDLSKAKGVLGDEVSIIEGDPATVGDWQDQIDGHDGVVNLCGEAILAKKWTPERKKLIVDSRIVSTGNIVSAIKRASNKPGVLISGSAIGIYGDGGSDELTEDSSEGDSFGAKLCHDWEEAANSATALGVRVVKIRTGDVLGKGGILAKMETPFKIYLGGPFGSGKQYTSWIHIDDHVGIVIKILEDESISGPVNLVAPNPVTGRQFADALGKALKKPSWFAVPKFTLDLMFGEGSELILESKKALPKKMLDSGYRFKFENLDKALADIYKN